MKRLRCSKNTDTPDGLVLKRGILRLGNWQIGESENWGFGELENWGFGESENLASWGMRESENWGILLRFDACALI